MKKIQNKVVIKHTNNSYGITLIALVVTMLVLLILLSVVLKLILGEEGVISKTKWSAYVTEYESVDEAKEMYASSHILEQYGENSKIVTKECQVATLENIGTTGIQQVIYPVSEKIEISQMADTLKSTIVQIEGLTESELTDLNKVNLYKVDFTKIDVKAKKQYAVNIVSGMLYSIESEEYKSNLYHTPRLGVAKSTKMTKVGTYEMIVDAGQIVSWDSVQIFYDKYVDNSLTCKVYTSDDEIVWKEENLTLGNSMEKEEKYTIQSAENTQFLKVEITINDVDGQNSEVDYVLVNFYKYKDTGIEPETTVTGAEQIAGIWTIPTPSNGETEANGTATVVQKVTVPADGGEYILDLEEIYGYPTTVIKITKPDGTVEQITITDSKDLCKITIPAGSKIEITTTLTGGNGIGPVKVLKKEENLSTQKIETVVNQTQTQTQEWVTVDEDKYVYNNAGTGFWEKCLVNDVEVDETGIIVESETSVTRIRIRYQTSNDGKSWSNYFSNIQDAANTQYLKVIVDYQVIKGNEYGDTSNNKVKVILNDGSWNVVFKDEDGTKLSSQRVCFTNSELTGTLTLPSLDDKTSKLFAGWKTEDSAYAAGTTYTVAENIIFTAYYINQDIYTVEDLCDFRDAVNAGNSFEGKTINLMADLDLSSVCGESIGNWVPIGNVVNDSDSDRIYFSGTFNGNGHTISNIYIYDTESYRQALFGSIKNAKIDCLNTQGNVTGYATVGGIVARINGANGCIITNCQSNVVLTTTRAGAGGMVGNINGNSKNVTIDNCKNILNVTSGENNAGGMVGNISGNSENITIDNCKNISNVTSGENNAGGMVGLIYDTSKNITISNCENTANVTSGKGNAGGVIGIVYSEAVNQNANIKITNCKNSGTIKVSNNYNAGGIIGVIGYYQGCTVENCSNTGNVSTTGLSNVGGIVGNVEYYSNCTISKCSNTGNITSNDYSAGGIIGAVHGYSTVNIDYVSNSGSVKTNLNNSAGGIVGIVSGESGKSYLIVNRAHNSGSVYAKGYSAGGILGVSWYSGEATIENSYNTGTILAGSGNYGGIIGGIDSNNAKGTIQYCHNVGTLSDSKPNKGTMVGYKNATYTGSSNYWLGTCNASYSVGSNGTVGNKYTAAQMKVQSNFSGWDFTNIWKMDTSKGYPVLRNMP